MFKIQLLVVLSSCVGNGELHTAVDESGCPPWTYRPNSTSPCLCGSSVHGAIQCNITTGELRVQGCLCVTYNPTTNDSVAGYCLYSCIANIGRLAYGYQLPMTRENFTDLSCALWNREGALCSQCIPGYGIPLHSYDLKCVKCSSSFQISEVIKFLAVSLLPPTVLCLVITVFHLNVLHPPCSVFVFVAQALSTPIVMQALTNDVYWIHRSELRKLGLIFITSFYDLWNLDFFQFLYNPTCISPTITIIQSHVIEAAIGLYPLVLLVVLHSFVTLWDRGCKVIVMIWKPFHFLLSRFRNKLNLKTSLIDTFATLLLLSYMKIGFAAFYVLTPTIQYSPDGSQRLVLYIDPSVKYFGSSHIGYAIITLLFLFVVSIIPILILLLYPFRWFQKCLNHFHLQLLPLHAFVDAFQGCYKDGTNGTQDCRYFAGLQLALRLVIPFAIMLRRNSTWCLCFSAVVFGLYITIFIIVRPYKASVYNKTDVTLLMALIFAGFMSYISMVLYTIFSLVMLIISVSVPLLYVVIWAVFYIKHIITRRTWCQKHTQETAQLLTHVE